MGHGLLLERKHVARGLPFPESLPEPGRYSVLAPLSEGYPHLPGRFPMYYSPVRHLTGGLLPFHVGLACVKHAASVRSEPGSNSPVSSSLLGPAICLLLFSCQRSPLSSLFFPRNRANLLILPKRPSPVKPRRPFPSGPVRRVAQQGLNLYPFPQKMSRGPEYTETEKSGCLKN